MSRLPTIQVPVHDDAKPWTLSISDDAGQTGPQRHEEWERLAREVASRLRRTTPDQFFAILRSAISSERTP